MSEIKVGDTVEALERYAGRMEIGERFVVTKVSHNSKLESFPVIYGTLVGGSKEVLGGMYAYRFKKVEPSTAQALEDARKLVADLEALQEQEKKAARPKLPTKRFAVIEFYDSYSRYDVRAIRFSENTAYDWTRIAVSGEKGNRYPDDYFNNVDFTVIFGGIDE